MRYMEQVKNAVKPHPLYGGMPIKLDLEINEQLEKVD